MSQDEARQKEHVLSLHLPALLGLAYSNVEHHMELIARSSSSPNFIEFLMMIIKMIAICQFADHDDPSSPKLSAHTQETEEY